MTAPKFEHANTCPVVSSLPAWTPHPVCDCGATAQQAAYESGWNAAYESGWNVAFDICIGVVVSEDGGLEENEGSAHVAGPALMRVRRTMRMLRTELRK